jgi:hypothetical protein
MDGLRRLAHELDLPARQYTQIPLCAPGPEMNCFLFRPATKPFVRTVRRLLDAR